MLFTDATVEEIKLFRNGEYGSDNYIKLIIGATIQEGILSRLRLLSVNQKHRGHRLSMMKLLVRGIMKLVK